jgi:RNA polymerase sigma factor (TIGR02999 family)
MHDEARGQVTRILQAIGQGKADGAADLLAVVYAELHRIAAWQMASERPGHTLQPTALVHEAYLRLLGDPGVSWENRAHFFSAAGEAMRRILVDRARAKATDKRGGKAQRVPLDLETPASQPPDDDGATDILALNDALSRLEKQDERMAAIVKLRFFAELTVDETATALNVSRRTVIRDWIAARAWLHEELTGTMPPGFPNDG